MLKRTLRERFERYVSPEPMSGCWLWTGGMANGYGRFFVGPARTGRNRTAPATRVAWELEHGISSRSGTFATYLGRLRALELVTGRGELRASEELFA